MEMTTVKTIAVFAIIFGCFAVLYPKIFHPMLMHMVGVGGKSSSSENMMAGVPPHLRKNPGAGKAMPDDIQQHMGNIRAGPHPGLRAAAEMKKAAATTGSPGKGGMMGIILPMYAVGIVIYLVYTMMKVFSGKSNKDEKGRDYLSSHFSKARQDGAAEDEDEDANDEIVLSRKNKRHRKDLERLLLKADRNNISELEMTELKRRLLDTEQQMTRILQAMETVHTTVNTVTPTVSEEPAQGEGTTADREGRPEETIPTSKAARPKTADLRQGKGPKSGQAQKGASPRTSPVDSSPDMESYDVISGKRSSMEETPNPGIPEGEREEEEDGADDSVEDIGADIPLDDLEEEGCFTEVKGRSRKSHVRDIHEDGVNEEDGGDAGEEEDEERDEDVQPQEKLIGNKSSSEAEQTHPDLRKRQQSRGKSKGERDGE